MTRKEKNETKPKRKLSDASFMCGLFAGVATAGVFNPYDRGLYLSVKERRPFLDARNFKSPYAGFLQSVWIRAFSGGLWFPLEHFFSLYMERLTGGRKAEWIAGSLAGVASSVILNPLQAVKYRTWGKDESSAFWKEVQTMYRRRGISPFLNGLVARTVRDVVFGAAYATLRKRWKEQLSIPKPLQSFIDPSFTANMMAAAVATVASAPFNYVQNIQYATSSRKAQYSIPSVLKHLARETMQQKGLQKVLFLQQRLRVGWGTVRVAGGMAFGNFLYDRCAFSHSS